MNDEMKRVQELIRQDMALGKHVSPVDLFTVHRMQLKWKITPEMILGEDSIAMKLYRQIFSSEELASSLGQALDAREAFWRDPYATISIGPPLGARFNIDKFLEICRTDLVKEWLKIYPDFFVHADRRICSQIRIERPLRVLAFRQPGNPTGDIVYACTRVPAF